MRKIYPINAYKGKREKDTHFMILYTGAQYIIEYISEYTNMNIGQIILSFKFRFCTLLISFDMVHVWLNELLLQFKLYSVYNPCWTSLSSKDILPARKENYSRQSPSCDIEMRLDALSEPTKNLPSQSLVSMPSTNLIPIKNVTKI